MNEDGINEEGLKELIGKGCSLLATGIMVAMGIGLVWLIIVILLLVTGRTTWAIVVGAPLAILVLVYLFAGIRKKIKSD